ncbi:ATPase component of various ABC-type transport systems with duplicated ATPase domain [Desulfosporosinus orientis DSM 765]|uniref:ATPase component of various ABC-type transport systems with duplicated ATPase domain n=1 Tax=Desulfosporosinus orientis (strain ATCC 19365 / DSM 765 / NCIMB 8382 / VKM B-1628 / Singapore I) TaxID=768706 RepID=G7WA52_DESOD|nr:ABC transporter ATP-binding protein [Desulfosporosinus orientis]AET66190.1 ATPase component of various ABC-type transport systems with duplicated ATPase domain [Desulfosporosinus orientis DSM 765]
MAFLQIKDLSFAYPKSQEKALYNVNLTIKQGEFVLVCGVSGCGKSTLLRHIKREIQPHGRREGVVYYQGMDIEALDQKISAAEIGFVMQNPETQLVTDTVWHELAFGLENLGLSTPEIRRKVAEMASFFGIDGWFRKPVDELSGGQKQLLNLAAVMVMQPKILILDEPTAQLDPIAAQDFLATIAKINRELEVTVILTEHRLEEVFLMADKVAVMDQGKILYFDTPEQAAKLLAEGDTPSAIFKGLPSAIRIFREIKMGDTCPLSVRDGRKWLADHMIPQGKAVFALKKQDLPGLRPVIKADEIWFKYSREGQEILRGFSLKAYAGEILSVLGGNGTGKTTMLGVISGLLKPNRGKVFIKGKKIETFNSKELYQNNLAFLPQNPKALFVCDTVLEDLQEAAAALNLDKPTFKAKIDEISQELRITALHERHPYDLSGGEQQKVALAKLLLLNPQIVLLDEPTKGLDPESKEELGEILKELCRKDVAIVLVTHDIEFAAEYTDRCAMMFDGDIVSEGYAKEFFAGNNFYTTAANRMAREIFPSAVTCEDVIELCKACV